MASQLDQKSPAIDAPRLGPSVGCLPMPRAPRYETLTVWRGIACLAVVLFHSACGGYGLAFPDGPGGLRLVMEVLRRLWIGVPFFFVISGYCVTASADAARRRAKPGPLFFWRRFRRIYPPYWAWLGVAILGVSITEHFQRGVFAQIFVPNPIGFTKWQWVGNLTLTETWRWHLTGGVESELLAPSWTLCYEEQFYALVGLTLICAPRFFFEVLTLLTVVIVAGLFLLPLLGFGTMGLFLDGKWLMFSAGVLVYYALNYAPARVVWFSLPLGFGLICAFASPAQLLVPRVNEPNQSYFCAFSFSLLLLLLHRWDAALTNAKILRPLFVCGRMSYSLYLIHWPVVTAAALAFNRLGLHNPAAILFLGLSFCVTIAISVAWVFHRLVERRFWNPGFAEIRAPVKA